MGNRILLIVCVTAILGITACANSENKWSKENSDSASKSESAWQKDQPSGDTQKKSTSSYWNDGNRY